MSSPHLGQRLARGRTADVYEWEEDRVLKLFHDWFDRENIEYEARLARAVRASGLPVPAVGDILQVDGHTGLIYERLHGPSMTELLQRKPWKIFECAERFAQLQAQLHTAQLQMELPSQRQRLESKIRGAAALSAAAQTAALTALASLPDGRRICHGDLHPGNILMTGQGAIIIDWIDATSGNPIADVARTTIVVMGAAQSGQLPRYLTNIFVRVFHRAYVGHYFRLQPGGSEEYRYWLPIVAAARLSENIPELEKWLVAQAHACKPMDRLRPDL
jgi:uncharacterized protein (TIGR02172 family)